MSVDLVNAGELDIKAEIKAVYFDVDGTLLDREGQYSPTLAQQIKRLRQRGIKTAVASGRPHFASQFLFDELRLIDPGVFCSGAYIYNPQSQKSVGQRVLQQASAIALIQRLRELNIYYELYTEQHYYYETDFAHHIRHLHAQHLRCQPVKADLLTIVTNQPVLKFIVGVDQVLNPFSLAQLESEFAHLQFAYAALPAYPMWHFASVVDADASKHSAFDWLLNYHGIDADNVVAFGDSHSDEVFLTRAGVGVAMGNAPLDVKQIARFVTRNSWEDGVAYALSRLIV